MTRKLRDRLRNFPTADDVDRFCREEIMTHESVCSSDLLRIYFYDAPPSQETLTNPISGGTLSLAQTLRFREMTSLLDALELRDDFALRMGDTAVYGWEIGKNAIRNMTQQPRALTERDLVPNIEQKGVDLRVGLDIARLALRELVGALVIVTGDSDFIPAFKFARREGVRVYLHHMGHSIRRELKAHTDLVIG